MAVEKRKSRRQGALKAQRDIKRVLEGNEYEYHKGKRKSNENQ